MTTSNAPGDQPAVTEASLSDQAIDRQLGGGQPAGPELDALWARIDADLEPHAATGWARLWQGKPWFRSPLFKAFSLSGALGAAAVVALMVSGQGTGAPGQSTRGGFHSRGEVPEGPVLEATCGSASNACSVGQPIFLRVHGSGVKYVVRLALRTGPRSVNLGGALAVAPGVTLAVPHKIVPELSDVDNGVIVEMTTTGADGRALPSIGLRLRVVP